MFKINIMQIMKFITAVVCFSLFGFAVYSMNQSKASPLPFLICACILYVVDGITSCPKGHKVELLRVFVINDKFFCFVFPNRLYSSCIKINQVVCHFV